MTTMKTTQKSILVVDDDLDQLDILGVYIENMGHSVIKIDSQKEAEQFLKNNKPDLAILDIMMENEDSGFILAYKLKSAYPEVPVMIISSVVSETGISFNLEEAKSKSWIKADSFIQKNIRQDQLHRELNRLLSI